MFVVLFFVDDDGLLFCSLSLSLSQTVSLSAKKTKEKNKKKNKKKKKNVVLSFFCVVVCVELQKKGDAFPHSL